MTTEKKEGNTGNVKGLDDVNSDDAGANGGSIQSGEIVRVSRRDVVETGSVSQRGTSLSPTENLVGMASIEDVLAWMDNFAKLKSRVIMQNPAYFTRLAIRGKEKVLINRSGWRAIQLAFNINDDIVKEETVMHPDGKNYTVRIWVKAWHAKSGRQVIGVGSCSTDEPGKVFQHPHHDVYATAHCVPLEAEILTKHGFKKYNEVKSGDEVLAYSVEKDKCHWTPLRKTTVYDSLQMLRMKSAVFDVRCSPDHSWAVETHPGRNGKTARKLMQATKLASGGQHRIILAAQADEGSSLLSPREAAILGWIATDGTIRESFVTRTKVNGKIYRGNWGPYVRVHIDQSKTEYVEEIRELTNNGMALEVITPAKSRIFPQGHESKCLPAHRFSMKSAAIKEIFDKASITTFADFKRVVPELSGAARSAMLQAMLHGDGQRKGGTWVFNAHDPEVMEIFQMLATLEGIALGKRQDNGQGTKRHTLRRFRKVDVAHLKIEEDGSTCAAWCPTTDYGTWIMRYNGQVCITGNTRAKNRAISDIVGAGEVSAEEIGGTSDSSPSPSTATAFSPRNDAERAAWEKAKSLGKR